MTQSHAQVGAKGPIVVVEADRGVLSVSGEDRQSWLNGIVSCELGDLSKGGAYGLILSKQGKIQSDLDVIAGNDVLFVTIAPGQTEFLLSTLDRMLIMEDAELTDRSADLVAVRVHGERAAEWLQSQPQVVASDVLDWTGAGGACGILRRSDLDSLSQYEDVDAWTQLRVERGFGVIGEDYDTGDNPHEAALERRAVSFSKGCYLGQEVVCMQDMRGKLKRRLSILEVTNEGVASGAVVQHDGKDVGDVRTVAPDGRLCLARLNAPFFEPGTQLSVIGASAQVVDPAVA